MTRSYKPHRQLRKIMRLWPTNICSFHKSKFLIKATSTQCTKLTNSKRDKLTNRAVIKTEFLETVQIFSRTRNFSMANGTRHETYSNKFFQKRWTTTFTQMKSHNSKLPNIHKASASITVIQLHQLKNRQHKLNTKQLRQDVDNNKV